MVEEEEGQDMRFLGKYKCFEKIKVNFNERYCFKERFLSPHDENVVDICERQPTRQTLGQTLISTFSLQAKRP
jgi:hypothetical protein